MEIGGGVATDAAVVVTSEVGGAVGGAGAGAAVVVTSEVGGAVGGAGAGVGGRGVGCDVGGTTGGRGSHCFLQVVRSFLHFFLHCFFFCFFFFFPPFFLLHFLLHFVNFLLHFLLHFFSFTLDRRRGDAPSVVNASSNDPSPASAVDAPPFVHIVIVSVDAASAVLTSFFGVPPRNDGLESPR